MNKILAVILSYVAVFGYVYAVTFVFCLLIYVGFALIFLRPPVWTTPAGWALVLSTLYFFIDGSDLPGKIRKPINDWLEKQGGD